MSDKGASDEEVRVLRCAYCQRDGKEMVDPRELPCSHSFCFNCLLEDMFFKENTDVFTCPLCIKHHDLFSAGAVDSLPACSSVVKGGLSGEAGITHCCITCADKGTKRAADSFCTKCENLFCLYHKKTHEEALNFPSSIVKHELIPVEMYCKSKAKFSSKYCPHHPESKLDGMCVNCNEFNCNTCRSLNDDCRTGNRHKNKLLNNLVDEMTTELTIAMEPALQFINDQQELLIQSNRLTEQNGEELDQMLLNVDQVMENQLEEIRSNYSQLKTRISALREANLHRKNAYQGEVQKNIRMVQNLIDDVKMSLETKHPVDIIKEGAALREKLAENENVELVSLELAHMELKPAERSRSIELQFGSAVESKLLLEIENDPGEPMKLYEFNSSRRLQLNAATLDHVLRATNGLPIVVLSVAGAFKGGKSFLLNIIMLYLQKNGRNGWFEDPSSRITGFPSRKSRKTVTTGIDVWSEPFIMMNGQGQRTAFILLDTQGTNDYKISKGQFTRIFALSTLLSDIQVNNMRNDIGSDKVDQLRYFLEFAKYAKPSNSTRKMLVMLVRDWELSPNFGFAGGNDYWTEQVQLGESANLQESLRSFMDVKCCVLPSPGDKVIKSPAFQGAPSDLHPDFHRYVAELVTQLFNENKAEGKTSQELHEWCQELEFAFRSEDLPEPKSLIAMEVEKMCIKARDDSLNIFESTVEAKLNARSSKCMSQDELNKLCAVALATALDLYDRQRKGFDTLEIR